MGLSEYVAPTVDFEDIEDPVNGTERFTERGFEATRILQCAWADRLTLADQLLSAYRVSQNGRTFLIGDKYPHRSRVYVNAVSNIQRVGAGSDKKARLSVDYSTREFDPENGNGTPADDSSGNSSSDVVYAIADEDLDFGGEYLTLPGQKLYWDAGQAEPLDDVEAPAEFLQHIVWTLRIVEVGTLPQSLQDNYGKVNQAKVKSFTLGWDFEPETLLFHGLRSSRQILSGTIDLGSSSASSNQTINTAWEVNLVFTWKPTEWNKWFRAGNPVPQPIYKSDGSRFRVHTVADFVGMIGA